MKKLIMHIPGWPGWLLGLAPLLLLIMVFTGGPGWLGGWGATGVAVAALILNRSRTFTIPLDQIIWEKGVQATPARVQEVIQNSLQRENEARERDHLLKSLQQARQAEKEAKGELAGFGRDLSSLNFRISELGRKCQAQQMQISGLRGENELLHQMVGELREENARLKGGEQRKTGT